MFKHVLIGTSTAALALMGLSAPALAKPSGPPPGCQHNDHPYGPPCGPPPNKGHDNNCSTHDQDDCPPPPDTDDQGGNGNDTGKNSAFVTHQSSSTSSTAGDLGIIATISGVSLAGLIALRKRPATTR